MTSADQAGKAGRCGSGFCLVLPHIVTAVDADSIALLTRAGKIKVQLSDADPQTLKRYENALIPVRGCVIPGRDLTTQQVELGRMRLANFSVNLDEPAPAGPTKKFYRLRF